MTTLQELYPDEYKPESEVAEKKKSKRGRPKKPKGVDVVDRTGIEDPAEPQVEIYKSRIEAVVKGGNQNIISINKYLLVMLKN